MSQPPAGEGSFEAPTRHPLDWRNPDFYDEAALTKEMERVFDICHGCRRCFSLCNSFPTLFDAVDESSTGEVDGVDKKVYWEVVDHCYLCDMCFMTKCPYVPPHPWNIDFPHLMLRAKATRNRKEGEGFANKALAATDTVGNLAGIPVVAEVVNAVNRSSVGRVPCWRRRSACDRDRATAEVSLAYCAQTPRSTRHDGERRCRRAPGRTSDRADDRQGRAVHDLLRKSQ